VRRAGFTLLEVVVAMAILGLGLLAIFDLNAGAVASHAYVKRVTIATQLARAKMTDLEQELYDKGFDVDDVERSGDFAAEGWNGFSWKARILAPKTAGVSADKLLEALFGLPAGEGGGLASLFSGLGGADGGLASLASSALSGGISNSALPPGATGPSGMQALGPFSAIAQTQTTQLLDQIRRGVREVRLSVSWKEGTRTESLDVVTHVVSLQQGSDRNGTPGVALGVGGTGTVPGAPGASAAGVGPGGAAGVPNPFGFGSGLPGFGQPGGAQPQGPPVNTTRPVGRFQPFGGN
jgi:general secretion pathway protein I